MCSLRMQGKSRYKIGGSSKFSFNFAKSYVYFTYLPPNFQTFFLIFQNLMYVLCFAPQKNSRSSIVLTCLWLWVVDWSPMAWVFYSGTGHAAEEKYIEEEYIVEIFMVHDSPTSTMPQKKSKPSYTWNSLFFFSFYERKKKRVKNFPVSVKHRLKQQKSERYIESKIFPN